MHDPLFSICEPLDDLGVQRTLIELEGFVGLPDDQTWVQVVVRGHEALFAHAVPPVLKILSAEGRACRFSPASMTCCDGDDPDNCLNSRMKCA